MVDQTWIRYVILLHKTGKEMTAALLQEHIAHLRDLDRDGRLVLCGPFQDRLGGMLIIRAASPEEAEAIARADPFVARGFEAYEIRAWELSCEENAHLGAVAQSLLVEDEIIALERAALERWCRGDPSGFLEISAPDVVYFDPFLERPLDGLDALAAYYAGLGGTVSATSWEMIAPIVRRRGDTAVLTFQFVSQGDSGNRTRWNCTEVYRRGGGAWRIMQTHWSFTQPRLG